MSEIKKFNHKTQQWEDYKHKETRQWEDYGTKQREFEFIPRILNGQPNPKSRPIEVSEDGRYTIDRENSYFGVGDMIEDLMPTNNMGVGFVVEKELFDGPIPYTYTDKLDPIRKVSSRNICSWKYLIQFPNPSKKGIARHGEIWLWEVPMRELLDGKLLALHRVKKNG